MTQPISPEDALKACPTCGAKCRVEIFPASAALATAATLWVCANNPQFGGDCQHRTAYLTVEAWNGQRATRTDPPKAVLDEEVVALRGLLVECQDRFRYLDQGVWVALIDDELTRLKDRGTD